MSGASVLYETPCCIMDGRGSGAGGYSLCEPAGAGTHQSAANYHRSPRQPSAGPVAQPYSTHGSSAPTAHNDAIHCTIAYADAGP